jgi:hypothetical protein
VNVKGPVSNDDLRRLLSDGTLTSNSLVWKQGLRDWQPAAKVNELASLLRSLPPEVPRVVRRHLGSSISFLLGTLAIAGGVSRIAQPVDDPNKGGALIAGVVMILGALAYRSAKKRKLCEVKSALTRQFLEIALIVLICLVIFAQKNLAYLIETDPVPNAVIPIWAIGAYLIVTFMPSNFMQRRG